MEIILDLKKRYTYADYLTWLDDKRRELIDGFVHLMSPAPALHHARISRNLGYMFLHFIKQKNGKCEVFNAPFDVRLPKSGQSDILTVVQPDICVVCDPSKLDERGCLGAPNLIVEIISKSTKKRDWNDKFQLYERSGVEEYWIVEPLERCVWVYELVEGEYIETVYEKGGKVKSKVLEGLEIDMKEVFEYIE